MISTGPAMRGEPGVPEFGELHRARTGKPSSNENRAASSRLKPRKKAAVKVESERAADQCAELRDTAPMRSAAPSRPGVSLRQGSRPIFAIEPACLLAMRQARCQHGGDRNQTGMAHAPLAAIGV
jgi:hypothetical protein